MRRSPAERRIDHRFEVSVATVFRAALLIVAVVIRDAAGRVVAFGRFQIVALIARPPLRLEPGETVTDRAPRAGELTGASTRAAAGRYQIRAAVPLLGVRANAFVYSAPVSVVLTSP